MYRDVPKKKMLTVLEVKPGKYPVEIKIEAGLTSLQKAVGGLIEAHPLEQSVFLLCDDEGKLKGLPWNRALRKGNEIYDIVAGTFLVIGEDGEDFGSLTQEQVRKYSALFYKPEMFVRTSQSIICIPVPTEFS